MNHIIRDRTKEETILIKKDFSELIKILESISVNFFIDSGLSV